LTNGRSGYSYSPGYNPILHDYPRSGINGNMQPVQKRAGLYYRTYINEGGKLQIPDVVPEDKYLILGDKRDTARDSREYGFIPRKEIKGKVFTIIRRRPL